MKPVVISLGGSLLAQPGYPEAFFTALGPLLKKRKIAVVCGGGQLAQKYADAARKKTGSEFYADLDAIKATRENAEKEKKAFGKIAFAKILKHPADAVRAIRKKNVVFSGGFLPGLTTDACSVLVAEAIGAEKVINASRVDGIYDKNPSEFPDAIRYDTLTHAELVDLASRFDQRKARTNFVFDIVASKLAARSKMAVDFVDGRNPGNIVAAVLNRPVSGTKVR